MGGVDREGIRAELAATRRTTLSVVAGIPDQDLVTQQDPIVSPINWDLAHLAEFETLWLDNRLDDTVEPRPLETELDAMEHERFERAALELPDRTGCLQGLWESRVLTLRRLEEVLDDHPLIQDGFVYHLILNHERQHLENMLYALQFVPDSRFVPPRVADKPRAAQRPTGMVRIDGGWNSSFRSVRVR